MDCLLDIQAIAAGLLTSLAQHNKAATTNTMTAVVTGKRKREIGLVVPAKYVVYTENQKHAQSLIKKLLEKQHLLGLLVHRELFKCLVYFICKFFI